MGRLENFLDSELEVRIHTFMVSDIGYHNSNKSSGALSRYFLKKAHRENEHLLKGFG